MTRRKSSIHYITQFVCQSVSYINQFAFFELLFLRCFYPCYLSRNGISQLYFIFGLVKYKNATNNNILQTLSLLIYLTLAATPLYGGLQKLVEGMEKIDLTITVKHVAYSILVNFLNKRLLCFKKIFFIIELD